MKYFFLLTIFIVIFLWIRQKKLRSKISCERCGEVGDTISYSASTNETTRDYCRVFGNFLYEKPLNLCFQCAIAQDSFLRALIMLAIEKQQKFGRSIQIEEAEKIWGNRAIDMLALLHVARGSMDSARRILKEEEFNKVKSWIEKTLGK